MIRNTFVFFFSLIILSVLTNCQSALRRFAHPEKGFVSWRPAPSWEEALLCGNGTMGALVFGKPHHETIIVNHALCYLPSWIPQAPINQASRLSEIRKLLADGRCRKAAEVPVDESEKEGYGEKKWIDPFVPLCDIDLQMPAGNVEDYSRMLDFETGEAKVEWMQDGNLMQRSLFVSRPDSLLVLKISGSSKVSASLALRQHPVPWEERRINGYLKEVKTSADDGYLTYAMEFQKKWTLNLNLPPSPEGFEGVARVIPIGGKVSYKGGRMIINDADEILVLMKTVPNYHYTHSRENDLKEQLDDINPDYQMLVENQRQVHGALFNRVSLHLGDSTETDLQSEALVYKAREKTSPSVIEKQFNAARYNIISSTGTNPPNLQGIWSGTWTPPWSSGFTHDGNVEVAVSSLLPSHTPELMKAYINYHERMMSFYRNNARRLFGTRGIVLPAHSSSHGSTIHFDDEWCLTFWTGGAGWTSSILYDYFLYTGDKEYLKQHIYPFMKEAAWFYEDFLIMGNDGKYIFTPSYSPENTPANSNAQAVVNATMDVMIAKELLHNCIEASSIVGENESQIAIWKEMLTHMPDYRINDDGALVEWLPDNLKDNYAHRHVSHLYALFEMIAPEFKDNPELMAAAQKAIERRMIHRRRENGGEMAFGLAQMGMIAANLRDCDISGEIINWISRYYFTPSLGTWHNSGNLFNMDVSGGFPAVVMRTLAYSEPGLVCLLPALPKDWETGSIRGMALRRQIIMDNLEWTPQGLTTTFTSAVDQQVRIEVPKAFDFLEFSDHDALVSRNEQDGSVTVNLKQGKPFGLGIKGE